MDIKTIAIITLVIMACGCIDNTQTVTNTTDNTSIEEEALTHLNNPDIPIPTTNTNGETPTTLVNFNGKQFENSDNSSTVLTNNVSSVDVSYNQLVNFLKEDQTDKIPFVNGSFECNEFALTLHNNAEEKGIRAGFVIIVYDSHGEHAINVFNTTDKGVIYVDDTGMCTNPDNEDFDTTVNLEAERDYKPISLFVNDDRVNWGPVKCYLVYW